MGAVDLKDRHKLQIAQKFKESVSIYAYALKGKPEEGLLLSICESEAFQAAKDYGVCIPEET